MTPTVEIRTERFMGAVNMLTRLTGISRKEIIKHEVTRVLDRCIANTVMATKASIARSRGGRAFLRSLSRPGLVINGRGQIWYQARHGKWLLIGQMHFDTGTITTTGLMRRDPSVSLQNTAHRVAAAYTNDRADWLQKAYDASGLAVQSWVQTADTLGLKIANTGRVGKARKAIATTGIFYSNGTARESTTDDKYGINIINTLPYNNVPLAGKKSMWYTLQGAVNGRASYLRRNLRLGVFNDMKKVAAAYPGLAAYLN